MSSIESAPYTHDVVAAAGRQHARFSITARQNPSVRNAITTIKDDGWTTIK